MFCKELSLVSYHINSDEGLITLRLAGDLDLVEIRERVESLLDDPQYSPHLPQLVDCRGIRPKVDKAELRTFTEFLTARYQTTVSASVAVVVDESLSADQTAGIYWLSCGHACAELFDNYDQALRWLMKREFIAESVQPLSQ